MNLKRIPPALAVAIFCASPFLLSAADVSGDTAYHYTFDLTEGRSCEGTSHSKPEEIARVSADGKFIQLDHYRTASGDESTVGFVNPRYIVRFHLSPATPAPEAKPLK